MKHSVEFVAVIALLFSAPLHAQETRTARQYDARMEIPMPARRSPKAVDVVEAPKPNEAKCPSVGLSCGPLDFAGKARYFARHSFGGGAFIGPLLWSAPTLAKPPAHYPNDWRQGPGALGRLYGDGLAFQTAAQTGKFLTGAAFHEDPRYSASDSRNPVVRAMHAIAFTAFDRSDSGGTTFAFSNFVGSASAGFVGTAYLPHGYNDTSHALDRMGIAFSSIAISNLAQEFTPEFRQLGKKMHLPGIMLPNSSNR